MKAAKISEDALQRSVIRAARLLGWLTHHARPAMTAKGWRTPIQGDPGFFDLVLVRADPPKIMFVEFKSDKGNASEAQERWHRAMEAVAKAVNNRAVFAGYLWRPKHWMSGEIEEALRE